MTSPLILFLSGLAILFVSSGTKTALPELVMDRARDASGRRQSALRSLRILWISRFGGLIISGAGAALTAPFLAAWLSLPYWLSLVILGLSIFLVGELLPSLLARSAPERFVLITRLPYLLLRALCSIPSLLVLGSPKDLEQEETDGWLVVPPDVMWLERRREKGSQDGVEQEQELMDGILDFADKIVREVMVPRIDMVCVDLEDSLESIVGKVTRAGHSRIPVFRDRIDNIIGVLYAKDLLGYLSSESPEFSLENDLREAYFVPEYKPVDQLFKEFQTSRTHIAIVVDEYGGTAGIVTIEDLMEEVFGEIQDEYDRETPLVHSMGSGTHRLDARLPIDDMNDLLGTDFKDDDYESLGGMLYDALGKIPRQGESVLLEGYVFTVEKVRAQRILLVRVSMEEGSDGE